MAYDLKSIISGTVIKPPKIVVYGVGGIGKTKFAHHAPKPFFIFTEDGRGTFDLSGSPVCKTYADVMNWIKFLYEGEHDYKTVVIDTIDEFEPLLWAKVCADHGQKSIDNNSKEFGFQKGYRHAADKGRLLLDGLDLLRDERKMAVIVLGHANPEKFDDPMSESYHLFNLRVHKLYSAIIHDWSDCFLFANYEHFVVKDDGSFGKERVRGVGQGKRILYTQRRPAFVAKERYGLPPELPFEWSAFVEAMTPSDPKPEIEKPKPKSEKKNG